MTKSTIIAAGKYKGRELDDSTRRSIVLRNADEVANGSVTAIVDYFYHLGEYWTAVIHLDAVREVLGQSFNFSKPKTRPGPNGPELIYGKWKSPRRTLPCLNHLQTRFKLETTQGVELFPLLTEPNSTGAQHGIDDIVYSLEAVGPLGVNFNLRDGMRGNLISAHRILSTEEMVFERIACERQWLFESPPLPLEPDQRRELLRKSLQRSHRSGEQEPYYLFRCWGTNNCTSNPFQILDSTIQYTWRQRLGSSIYRLPMSPRWYLKLRGMDPDPRQRNLVREEFAEYIESKATQRRKREVVRAKVRQEREMRASA